MSTLYYVRSSSLGTEPEIGRRLAQAFWNSLHERVEAGSVFAFANESIFFALDDSPVLEGLRKLIDKGCRIYVCGSCMDYFGVRQRLAVGEPGSIPLLQELMVEAAKVITF
jgi:hypothetical protein